MYFFVRFLGIMVLIVGILLMFLGFGAAIYGFLQNAAVVDYANHYLLAGSNMRMVDDARIYSAILGLGLFLLGMFSAGLGQLMLVFADVAANTRETTAILRGLQRIE